MDARSSDILSPNSWENGEITREDMGRGGDACVTASRESFRADHSAFVISSYSGTEFQPNSTLSTAAL
ncbi:hypothetical protein GCM10022202_08420 [Microbacterium marinilacus]|uniref:DUF397 domain-containing protein n=1 Tax=Microbacterium marinilacus TaxID=415209 RepID=A0ABP7B6I6_9MICO